MKPPAVCASLIALTLAFILVFGKLSLSMTLVSAGAAVIVYSMTNSIQYATGSAILVLFTTAILMRYGIIKKEGFNVFTGPEDISRVIRKLKESFRGRMDDEEEFRNRNEDEEEGFRSNRDDEEEVRNRNEDEEMSPWHTLMVISDTRCDISAPVMCVWLAHPLDRPSPRLSPWRRPRKEVARR